MRIREGSTKIIKIIAIHPTYYIQIHIIVKSVYTLDIKLGIFLYTNEPKNIAEKRIILLDMDKAEDKSLFI